MNATRPTAPPHSPDDHAASTTRPWWTPPADAAGDRTTGWGGLATAGVAEWAARLADLLLDVAAASGAAVAGAAVGGARATRALWAADRPRRLAARSWRRRRWWRRGGWWRLLCAAEIVAVGAWIVARSAAKLAWASPPVVRAAADEARGQWHTRFERADTHHQEPTDQPTRPQRTHPRPAGPTDHAESVVHTDSTEYVPGSRNHVRGGQGGVDAEPVLGQVDPDPAAGTSRPGRSRGEVQGEDVVDAEVVCAWLEEDGEFCGQLVPDGELFCPHHGSEPTPDVEGPTPYERTLSALELARHRRLCALRDRGYRSWADRDGRAVDRDGRPLSPAEIEAVIAAGGWPADELTALPARVAPGPQSPTGHPAGGLHEQEEHMQQHDDRVTTVITSGGGPGGSGTVVQGGSRPLGGELTNIADLRAETGQIAAMVEQCELLADRVASWARGLPEKVTAAPWSTEAINSASIWVREAAGSTRSLRERLTGLLGAVQGAQRLGEVLAVGGGQGDVAGLIPQ